MPLQQICLKICFNGKWYTAGCKWLQEGSYARYINKGVNRVRSWSWDSQRLPELKRQNKMCHHNRGNYYSSLREFSVSKLDILSHLPSSRALVVGGTHDYHENKSGVFPLLLCLQSHAVAQFWCASRPHQWLHSATHIGQSNYPRKCLKITETFRHRHHSKRFWRNTTSALRVHVYWKIIEI